MQSTGMKVVFAALLFVIIAAFAYNIYSSRTLPKQPTVARAYMIDLGKGPKVYGTRAELNANRIVQGIAIVCIVGGALGGALLIGRQRRDSNQLK